MAPPQSSQPRPLSEDVEALSYVINVMEAFKAFDSDSDGFIAFDELRGLMASLGYNITAQEVKEMMIRGDADRDGFLSLGEFLEMNTAEMDLGGLAAMLQAAVTVLAGGEAAEEVTGEELCRTLGLMGNDASMEECMDIVACLDADGDGAVSIEDLKTVAEALN